MSSKKTVRAELAEWITKTYAGSKTIDIAQVTEAALAWLAMPAGENADGERQEDRTTRWLRESLRAAVADQMRQIVGRGRKNFIQVGDVIISKDDLRASVTIRAKEARWLDWNEWNGNVHISLMAMTGDDLRAAAAIRAARGLREASIANLWLAIADRLSMGQCVSDALTPADITIIAQDCLNSNKQDTAR